MQTVRKGMQDMRLSYFKRVFILFLVSVLMFSSSLICVAESNKNYENYISNYSESTGREYILESELAISSNNFTNDKNYGKVLKLSEGEKAEWSVDVFESGWYFINVHYMALPASGDSISVELLIDGKLPFEEADSFLLERSWINEDEKIFDIHGNQIRAAQVETQVWQNKKLHAAEASTEDLKFYFSAGRHTVSLNVTGEACLIESISLKPITEAPEYADVLNEYKKKGYKDSKSEIKVLEAESNAIKSSQSLYPLTDRSSPNITPYSAEKIKYNTVGGTQWKMVGQWIEWTIDFEQDGLYVIGLNFKQSLKTDAVSIRELYIDGELPFSEAADLQFTYGGSWQTKELGYTEKGKIVPYKFYFTKGKHTIRLQVGLGSYDTILNTTDDLILELNQIYRRIVVVTGTTPDTYRNYQFEKVIPDVLEDMSEMSKKLKTLEKEIRELGFSGNQGTDTIKRLYNQIDWMLEDSDTIAKRLTTYRDNISALGTWRNGLTEQPLILDKIYIAGDVSDIPDGKASFFANIIHQIRQFLNSYISDYASIGEMEKESNREIKVWMSTGRDQAQILKSLITQKFAPVYKTTVNLEIVTADSLLPALLAETGPDVSIGLAQAEPINLALRNALTDLTTFDDYKQVASRYHEQSIVPFTLNEKVYALPDTLSYMMLFYRKDVIEEMGISVDDLTTWDDLLQKVLPVVQKSGLSVGIPANIGTFVCMFSQLGGETYLDDGKTSGLASTAGIEAMNLFEKIYSQYKLPLAFDAANRFRSGEMPIMLADYLFYNQLTVFAPEISGTWSMLPTPGTLREDGTVNHLTTATTTCSAIMKNAKDQEAAWSFLKWWQSAEIQSDYGRDLESVVGSAARYNTANLEALDSVKWDAEIAEQLNWQRDQLVAYPEVPGGYFTQRHFDFAFRKILYENQSVRTSLEEAVEDINSEIARKREEYKLP